MIEQLVEYLHVCGVRGIAHHALTAIARHAWASTAALAEGRGNADQGHDQRTNTTGCI
jgi:hypothetical protein